MSKPKKRNRQDDEESSTTAANNGARNEDITVDQGESDNGEPGNEQKSLASPHSKNSMELGIEEEKTPTKSRKRARLANLSPQQESKNKSHMSQTGKSTTGAEEQDDSNLVVQYNSARPCRVDGCKLMDNVLKFRVCWLDTASAEMVSFPVIRNNCPQELIDFLISRLVWSIKVDGQHLKSVSNSCLTEQKSPQQEHQQELQQVQSQDNREHVLEQETPQEQEHKIPQEQEETRKEEKAPQEQEQTIPEEIPKEEEKASTQQVPQDRQSDEPTI